MRIIVNTNRIIAALIRDSVSRRLLFSGKADFCTLETAKAEVAKYRAYIAQKSGLTSEAFDETFQSILQKMLVYPKEGIEEFVYREAQKIMDSIDPDDTPFIALALSIPNDGIWTDDQHFARQKKIQSWSTPRLLKRLGLKTLF